MTERIFNFSAGPAVLPVPVLEKAREEMLSLPGVGMSVMEISHRSKTFDAIHRGAKQGLKALLGIPGGYHVLFLQGGASLQFSMLPQNFLQGGASADYILTGSWGQKAIKEAKKFGATSVAADMADSDYNRVPAQDELKLDPNAAYVHVTSNETIEGVEWKHDPEVGDVPLVCDASSDICSRPVDVSKYAVIDAGAQKTPGPSGVTLVILRDDMLSRIPDGIPTMLDYRTHTENDSLYNTPNTWGIYILTLVCEWMRSHGGLEGIPQRNQEKARTIYHAIHATHFYRGHAASDARSLMNITSRLPSEELEKKFTAEATAQGLDGLKGHRSVGGIRASIYNAFPKAGVAALASFMRHFERTNG